MIYALKTPFRDHSHYATYTLIERICVIECIVENGSITESRGKNDMHEEVSESYICAI